jgi:hypothetical protein
VIDRLNAFLPRLREANAALESQPIDPAQGIVLVKRDSEDEDDADDDDDDDGGDDADSDDEQGQAGWVRMVNREKRTSSVWSEP